MKTTKLLLSLVTLGTLQFNAYASTFCDDAYQSKIANLAKHEESRTYGATVIGTLPLVIAFGPGAIVGGLWLGGLEAGYLYNQYSENTQASLKAAMSLFEMSQLSREEVKEQLYPQYILRRQRSENYYRGDADRPLHSEAEIMNAFPYEDFKFTSVVDESLKQLNRQRKKQDRPALTYSEFQDELATLTQTDTFCPENKKGKRKPKTLKQVIRTMAKTIQ
jgi:hypothetical protein